MTQILARPQSISEARTLAAASNTRMLIGGELSDAIGGATMRTISPTDGEPVVDVPRARAADVDAAVGAARKAYPEWRSTDLLQRRRMLLEVAARIREDADALAALDVLDSGATLAPMRSEVEYTALTIEWIAGLLFNAGGREVPAGSQSLNFTTREPHGVAARIVAFNHPLFFGATKLAAPVLAGNCVVVKVPDQTPSSMLRLAPVLADIFPPGVVNVISGIGAEAGDALVRHDDVSVIAFTGSARTGKLILHAAADRVVPVVLELGGKNPMIVCPDADLDLAAAAVANGMNFKTAGQSCGSYSRLFLHDDVYDDVVDRVVDRFRDVRVGDPFDPTTEMGPVIDEAARSRYEGLVAGAISAGARRLCGGEPVDGVPPNGIYVSPMVLGDVTQDMVIANEEVFGPVLCLLRWSDVASVVREANAVRYGLTAAVSGSDIDVVLSLARELEAGSISVNGDGGQHWFGAPFGGFKESGLGKEESIEELTNWTREKNINLRIRAGA